MASESRSCAVGVDIAHLRVVQRAEHLLGESGRQRLSHQHAGVRVQNLAECEVAVTRARGRDCDAPAELGSIRVCRAKFYTVGLRAIQVRGLEAYMFGVIKVYMPL